MKVIKKFSLQDIYNLYSTKVKLQPEYFKKYENILEYLPEIHKEHKRTNQYNNRDVALFDFSRVWTILDFKEWIEKYNINPINKLLVTCQDPEEIYLDAKYVRKADYEVDRWNNDLHNLCLDERDFDFILFSQTLEHVYNPTLCMINIANHVKQGGYVFTSVPTVSLPHMTPVHFQSFTPMGLATLFLSVGLEPVEIGQYGSKNYIDKLFSIGWPNYTQLLDENNKIVNEEDRPCQTWILAKKL